MKYGEIIPGLVIDGKPAPYPVINERKVRATAGLMFLIGISTFWFVFLTKNYTPMYIVVPLFWLDFSLKTFLNPRYSIFGFIAGFLVKKQKPEYVGAIQKRFAWAIGFLLASYMLIFAVGLGVRGMGPFAVCVTCLLFMWLESALGICAGCKLYSFLIARGILKEPTIRPACPGGVCVIEE